MGFIINIKSEKNLKDSSEKIEELFRKDTMKNKLKEKKNLKRIVICVVIMAVLLVGGLAIHSGRTQQAADTHMEFELGDDTAVAIN